MKHEVLIGSGNIFVFVPFLRHVRDVISRSFNNVLGRFLVPHPRPGKGPAAAAARRGRHGGGCNYLKACLSLQVYSAISKMI